VTRATGRRRLGGAVAGLALAGAATPARAQEAVDLQLVLAVDASGSVSPDRWELQRRGYAAAFRHPRVLRAIRNGAPQGVAVTMMQWTGPGMHALSVPWTVIADEAGTAAFAAAIEAAPRRLFGGGTSVSAAIDFAATLLAAAPHRAPRRIIDVSGDGANNRGRPAEDARDEAVARGIRINGLPILGVEYDLDGYYRRSVIGGPGAFVVAAQGYENFAEAILMKLVLEIA
jgi:hypothetical protein